MIAQCAPDTDRSWFSAIRGDAEFAKFAEATGLMGSGNGKQNKYER